MNRMIGNYAKSDVYERIQEAPMSEREREVALNAVRNAEAIVDGCAWAARAVKTVIAKIFEKPADFRHSH